MPILIQVYFNSGLAYLLNRRLGVAHCVAGPSALIGASNFFELAVAAAISLFGFHSGAALATVVGVLIEVPVMLSVVWHRQPHKALVRSAPGRPGLCAGRQLNPSANEGRPMARMHIHIAVDDLEHNIGFYSALFGAEPTVVKGDYAKWELADPAVNFALSSRGRRPGLDHIGIQAGSDAELVAIRSRLEAADIAGAVEEGTACCYARSDKYWVQDPQGIAWETFHTLDSIPTFNGAQAPALAAPAGSEDACCARTIPVPFGS